MPKQLSRIDAGIDLNVSFPTKQQKDYQNGTIRAIPTMPIFHYLTNYDRRNPKSSYRIIPFQPGQLAPVADPFWEFKTNLDQNDFDFVMSDTQKQLFLNKMWEIYRYRKAD